MSGTPLSYILSLLHIFSLNLPSIALSVQLVSLSFLNRGNYNSTQPGQTNLFLGNHRHLVQGREATNTVSLFYSNRMALSKQGTYFDKVWARYAITVSTCPHCTSQAICDLSHTHCGQLQLISYWYCASWTQPHNRSLVMSLAFFLSNPGSFLCILEVLREFCFWWLHETCGYFQMAVTLAPPPISSPYLTLLPSIPGCSPFLR